MTSRRLLFTVPLLFATVLGISAAARNAPVPKMTAAEELKARDLRKLQGKWAVVREVYCGTLQEGDRGTWTFKDDTLKVNDLPEAKFAVNVSARPKRLVRTFTDKEGRKRTRGYIYTFDDDHLLLSGRFEFFNEEKPPADFGSDMNFLRLKRQDD